MINTSNQPPSTRLKFDTSYHNIRCFTEGQTHAFSQLSNHRKWGRSQAKQNRGSQAEGVFEEKDFLCSVICKLFGDADSQEITQFITKMTYSPSPANPADPSSPEADHQKLIKIFNYQNITAATQPSTWDIANYQSQFQPSAAALDSILTSLPSKSDSNSTFHSSISEYSLSPEELTQEAYIYYQNLNIYRQLQRKCRSLTSEAPSQFAITPSQIEQDGRTTLMIRHIPNKYTEQTLLQEISKKFRNRINFLYLPLDSYNECNMGYAFVNFTHTRYIRPFYDEFNGRRWSRFNSGKICELAYARIQGTNSLISHFEHSLPVNKYKGRIEGDKRQVAGNQVRSTV